MSKRCARCGALAFVAVLTACMVGALPVHAEKLPWTLRDHYTFRHADASLIYAVNNAEWCLVLDGVHLIDDVRPRVALADGRVLGLEAFKGGVTNRERSENAAGSGIRHIISMESEGGVLLEHSIKVQRERAFFLVEMTVTNNTGEPLEVAKLSPAVVEPGGMAELAPSMRTNTRPLATRMGFPLFDKDGPPLAMLFEDNSKNLLFAMGVFPQGVADSGVAFHRDNGQWRGEVTSQFDPPLTLAPGESLSADPMWLAFSLPTPASLDRMFSWAHSMLSPKPSEATALPDAWITVPDGASADMLYDTVDSWSLSGVTHAVVPHGWQQRLGALDGGSGYPTNMNRVATSLRRKGQTPGIVVDPLALDEAPAGAAIEQNGAFWVNPAAEAGAAALRERGEALADLGFELLVLTESEIPQQALKGFGLTHAQAEYLAFEALSQGAPDAVVVPAPRAALRGDLSSWLEAAASASRMREYGVAVGPVRFEGFGSSEPDAAVMTAMSFFGGPVEIATRPEAELGRMLDEVFPRANGAGRPQDLLSQAPRIWETPLNRSGDTVHGSALVVFPGADPWPVASVQLDAGAPAKVWRAEDGQRVDMQGGVIPSTDALTVYGLTASHTRPFLVGALSNGGAIGNSVNRLSWDDSTGVLTGQICGRSGDVANAYVYVPEPWRLQEGSVSTNRGEPRQEGRLVAFEAARGQNTNFELTFSRGR